MIDPCPCSFAKLRPSFLKWRAAPDAWLLSARLTFNSGAITAFGALMAAGKTNGWIVLVTAYPSAN